MVKQLIDIRQIDTGFLFNDPLRGEEEEWEQWYEGDFTSLFPEPTINNGGKLHSAADRIEVPLHGVSSDYFRNTTWADRPSIATKSPEMQAFLDQNQERVFKVVERSLRSWSIFGIGIVLTHEDGSIIEINPRNYYRVGPIQDPDELVGHIVVHTWYEPDSVNEMLNPQAFANRIHNRAIVIRYSPKLGINTSQLYALSGEIVLGEALEEERPAGITAFCTYGNGYSWYSQAKSTAAAFMTRLTNNNRVLNRHDNRVRILPEGTLPAPAEGDTRSEQERLNAQREEVDPVLFVGNETRIVAGELGQAAQYNDEQVFLEYLADQWNMITGIPPGALAVSLGRSVGALFGSVSGAAIEKSQDRAATRIRDARNDLQRCIPALFSGIGAPEADLAVEWLYGPFENEQERTDQAMKLLGAGIIDINEARAMIGREAKTLRNVPQEIAE